MKKIVLASSSPRRKEILNRFGIEFKVMPSGVEEDFKKEDNPLDVAKSLAFKKCEDIAYSLDKGYIVIAADTIVYCEKILGKPQSRSEAFQMIKCLSGKTHKVITGVAIIDLEINKRVVDCEVTEVVFRDLTDEKIERYLNTEEYVDKAGAYGIQGFGEVLVKSINGSFSNVVGLPISKLDCLLEDNFNLKLL